MSVSTFNPDADPESTSVDGVVAHTDGAGTNWNDIRTGAGTSAHAADTSFPIDMFSGTGGAGAEWVRIRRAIFLFDTSSLPDTDTITAAELQLYVTATPTDDFGSQEVAIVDAAPASDTALAASDYGNVGTTQQAANIAVSSITGSAYNDFILNATGIANINKTGITKFGARFESDRADSEPSTTAAEEIVSVRFQMADNGSNEPILEVTHEEPSGAVVVSTLPLLGVG